MVREKEPPLAFYIFSQSSRGLVGAAHVELPLAEMFCG